MKKLMMLVLSSLCATTWAHQNQIHSLMPIKNDVTLPAKMKVQPFNLKSSLVKAGGYGGNTRTGLLTYSGNPDQFPSLTVLRAADTGQCYLDNENARIFLRGTGRLINFPCFLADSAHNNLYWDAYLGTVNGSYSPENDILYAADVVTNMFNDWYRIPPVINKQGFKIPIRFGIHYEMDNTYSEPDGWIDIGDGYSTSYPHTSLNVIAYMVGQVFTDQHSKVSWYGSESGGIHIAFSCMTAMAAEYYVNQKNTWQVGGDINKNGLAFHYLDRPSKNCEAGGLCDIDTLAQFNSGTSRYQASGLFNRAFYLLATTNGWDTHKAYDVFVQANRYHWNNTTNFQTGACAVVGSAKELGYDVMSVMLAFSRVGIDTRKC